ncbi:MAG: XTP/dITP diphosphatase [Conexivisphaerales archaeon]
MDSLKFVFATHNEGKFKEASFILSEYGIKIEQKPIKGTEIQAEDIIYVVKHAAKNIRPGKDVAVIVDDAGLYIDALNGFPGAFSSYVQKTIGNKGILKLMKNEKRRSAHFDAAVALRTYDKLWVFTGRVNGTITEQERGFLGFGYDPIFIPEGESRTFAEMKLEEKCKISHRALALGRLATMVRNIGLIRQTIY